MLHPLVDQNATSIKQMTAEAYDAYHLEISMYQVQKINVITFVRRQ